MKLKSYCYHTDQGPYLNFNEDAVGVDIVNGLYMVVDAFGGSGVGDKAATLVKDTVNQFYTKVSYDNDATMPFFYSHRYLLEGNALINAIKYAHNVMMNDNKDKDMNTRGGACIAAIAESGGLFTCASVGNCLSLVNSKGKIHAISTPHNHELLLTDKNEKNYALAPLSGLGLFEDLSIDIKEFRVSEGDQVYILSDGAYGRIEYREIVDILSKTDRSLQKNVQMLFDLNNSRGNLDNQSAIVLNF